MADWDINEAPRTRVILVDSHVLAGASLHARDDTPPGRQIVIISPSPAEPRNYPGPQQDTSSSRRLAGTVTCQPDHGIRARAELRDRQHPLLPGSSRTAAAASQTGQMTLPPS
jgi:hypothetical protein